MKEDVCYLLKIALNNEVLLLILMHQWLSLKTEAYTQVDGVHKYSNLLQDNYTRLTWERSPWRSRKEIHVFSEGTCITGNGIEEVYVTTFNAH